MERGERLHPRHTKASALRDEWAAQREYARIQLIRRVESEFRDVRLGGGVSLHQARAIDDYEDDATVAAVRAMDTEVRWQDISDEKLSRLSDTLPFMDAEGFRFHIPRFMVFALRSEALDSSARGSAICWADIRDTSGRLELLSDQQRDVVRAFAEFYTDEA